MRSQTVRHSWAIFASLHFPRNIVLEDRGHTCDISIKILAVAMVCWIKYTQCIFELLFENVSFLFWPLSLVVSFVLFLENNSQLSQQWVFQFFCKLVSHHYSRSPWNISGFSRDEISCHCQAFINRISISLIISRWISTL